MLMETQRLMLRDLKPGDETAFAEMAMDGSLNDIGFDKDCGRWIGRWMEEATEFAVRDNPCTDYLAYAVVLKDENVKETGITYFIGTRYRENGYAVEAVNAYREYFLHRYPVQRMIATVRAENIPSWKVLEKTGFVLTEKKR